MQFCVHMYSIKLRSHSRKISRTFGLELLPFSHLCFVTFYGAGLGFKQASRNIRSTSFELGTMLCSHPVDRKSGISFAMLWYMEDTVLSYKRQTAMGVSYFVATLLDPAPPSAWSSLFISEKRKSKAKPETLSLNIVASNCNSKNNNGHQTKRCAAKWPTQRRSGKHTNSDDGSL